jgi:hypothetical protein
MSLATVFCYFFVLDLTVIKNTLRLQIFVGGELGESGQIGWSAGQLETKEVRP